MAEIPQRFSGITVYGLPANPLTNTLAIDSADGILKKWNGSSWVAQEGTIGTFGQTAILRNVMAAATANAVHVAATWNAKSLNTVSYDPSGIILNSGVFPGTGGSQATIQLAAGTYHVDGSTVAYNGKPGLCKLRLRNLTNSTTALVGGIVNLSVTSPQTLPIFIKGSFTIGATSDIQMQFFTTAAGSAWTSVNFAEPDILSTLRIVKVA